jgi:hypothetical protein
LLGVSTGTAPDVDRDRHCDDDETDRDRSDALDDVRDPKRDRKVDEASEESFPASDPPSFWAGTD